MELTQYLQTLRQRWKLIWSAVLVGIGLASVAVLLIQPTYASTAQLLVSNSNIEVSSTTTGGVAAQQKVVTYAELLTGTLYVGQVIDQLGLEDTPGELIAKVAVTANPDTTILSITVTDTSPEEAQLVANTMAGSFPEYVRVLETPEPTITETPTGEITTETANPPFKLAQVQFAGRSATPVAPDPMVLLPLGAIVGLLIGVLLALVRSFMDNTVKTSKQVEELTGAASVGGVVFDPMMAGRPLSTQFSAHSITGEAYRQIRTNLQFVNVDAPPRVLVITSSLSGEGKTTTAINLALVLAQSGQRVALIEADLRRPRVSRYLQLVSGAGLTNILAGNAELSDLLQPYGDGNLNVLAAGPHPPNPSELLGSDHMARLLAELRATHDYVIIDAPPLLPVTDAAVLAVLADGAVIVTRYGTTKRDQLRASADILRGIDARVVGTVLNMVTANAGGYGYGYGYGYSYEPDPNPRDELNAPSSGRRSGAGRGRTTLERTDGGEPDLEPGVGEAGAGSSLAEPSVAEPSVAKSSVAKSAR